MTTIGLVSDTHLPRFGRSLPRALEDGLRNAKVSGILHMGDMTDDIAIPLFEAIAPVDAVAGNNDPESIRVRFGRRKVLTVDGVRIGLVHGDMGRANARDNAIAAFNDETLDVILYGHSHRPKVEHLAEGLLLANPGSPTDKRMMPFFSYGILTIADGKPAIELKYFPSR